MRGSLVWDAPIRVVHWMIAALVLVAWLTRSAESIDVHVAAGYCAIALALFRVAWGFLGTAHARFASFLYSPLAALRYVRGLASGRADSYDGHNPAGSWSVLGLIALQLAVALTGIIALGGMHDMGPLASRVDFAAADLAHAWHDTLAWAMLALVAAHLLGVAASSLAHRENLVAAMITGRKRSAHGAPVAAHGRLAALVAASALALGAGYLVHARDAAKEAADSPRLPVALAAEWARECESCHLPYAPCFLPRRSWDLMIEGAANHFGEDLALDEETRQRLRAVAAAPLSGERWGCWKTRSSVPSGHAPLRITETPYWIHAHRRIPREAFQAPRSNGAHDCAACHGDAASSIFHPRSIRIPK